MICEVFLFHLHSKSFSYSVNKEYEFEVKLPTGFYSARDNSDGSKNFIESEIAGPGSSNVNKKQSEQETDKENHIEKHLPSGSKITITRIKRKISIEEKLNENNEESDSEENIYVKSINIVNKKWSNLKDNNCLSFIFANLINFFNYKYSFFSQM